MNNYDDPTDIDFNERESEILRLMAEGYTNREMSEKLFVSINTVRWHNKQVYSKLGVHKRTLAVARARELGFFDTEETETITPIASEFIYNNFTQQLTHFIGREDELAIIRNQLRSNACRLLTLVGLGGVGKTRLAIEASRRNLVHFSNGALFIPCAALKDSSAIIPTILYAMDLTFSDESNLEQLLFDALRDKQLLLVIDNLEHISDVITLISDILRNTSEITLLLTSRECLNLAGEHVIQVEGLPRASDTILDPLKSSAVQLFVQGARQRNSVFELNSENVERIIAICELVEGLPLAIEIASAWISILSLEEILTEIEKSLDFLKSQSAQIPERHRSIHAVIDSTWQRLTEAQRTTFKSLSVFRGGFTRDAADSVAGADLHTLLAFKNKSLLGNNSIQKRYDLHELLRQYAEDQLLEDRETAYRAHYEYYIALLKSQAERLTSDQWEQALELCSNDFENIRLAWDRIFIEGKVSLLAEAVPDLFAMMVQIGRFRSGWQWVDVVVRQFEKDEDHSESILVLREYRGRFSGYLGNFGQAIAELEQVLHQSDPAKDKLPLYIELGKLCRRADTPNLARQYLNMALQQARLNHHNRMIAEILYHLGTVSWDEGNNHDARRYYDEAVLICERENISDSVAAQVWHGLGESLLYGCEPREAIRAFRQSLDFAPGNLVLQTENKIMMGWTMTEGVHELSIARDWFNEALDYSKETNIGWHKTCAASGLGMVEGHLGNYHEGLALLDYAVEVAVEIKLVRLHALALDQKGTLFRDLNMLPEAESEHNKGLKMAQEAEFDWWIPRLQANLCIDRLRQGDVAVGDDLQMALDMALANGQLLHVSAALFGMVELCLAQNQADKAQHYTEQLQMTKNYPEFPGIMAETMHWRGRALTMLNKFQEAETVLKQALDLARLPGHLRLIRDIHSALSDLYMTADETVLAKEHQEAIQRIRDGIAKNLKDNRLRERFLSLQR